MQFVTGDWADQKFRGNLATKKKKEEKISFAKVTVAPCKFATSRTKSCGYLMF